jgi:hypothetical protein
VEPDVEAAVEGRTTTPVEGAAEMLAMAVFRACIMPRIFSAVACFVERRSSCLTLLKMTDSLIARFLLYNYYRPQGMDVSQ